MKFSYDWTRKDLKKELISKRYNTNILFLMMGILIYGYLMYIPMTSDAFDKKTVIAGALMFLTCYIFLLIIFTRIYVFITLRKNDKRTNKAYGTYYVECDDNHIVVKINDIVIEYKYEEITKFKRKRNNFFIRTKEDKIGLLFKKKVIGKENYDKLLEYLKNKIVIK